MARRSQDRTGVLGAGSPNLGQKMGHGKDCSAPETPFALPRRELVLLSLAAFASSAALRLCDPMLPALADTFHTRVTDASLVVTATSIAYALSLFLVGPLGDGFGKLRVIAWACLASTLGTLACAVSPSLDLLSLSRALTGATTAALIPLSMAWIGDRVPIHLRQPTLAKLMSGQILGLVTGQAVGGLFADTLGWRWAFVLFALIYFIIGLGLARSLSASTGAASRAAPGALAGARQVWRSPRAGVVLGTVFVEAMLTLAVLAFLPAYLHERFGLSLFQAGLIAALFGLGGLVYTLFAGRWVGRLGEFRLCRSGGLLLGIAFLTLALADHWAWALAACPLAGLGFYQLHNSLQTQATQLAPEARGTAVSLFAACFFLAQAVGVGLGARIIEHWGTPLLFAVSSGILPLLGWYLAYRLSRMGAGFQIPSAQLSGPAAR